MHSVTRSCTPARSHLLLKKEKGFLEGCFSEKLGWQVLAGEAAL